MGFGIGGAVSISWLGFYWFVGQRDLSIALRALVCITFVVLLEVILLWFTPKTTGPLGTLVGAMGLPLAANQWYGIPLPPTASTLFSVGLILYSAHHNKRQSPPVLPETEQGHSDLEEPFILSNVAIV